MKYFLLALFFLGALQAEAKNRANLGLGYGEVDQKFDTTESDYSSFGGFLEAHYDWNNVLFGINFTQVDGIYNVDNFSEDDLWVGGPYIGFNFFDRIEVIGGYVVGRSKRQIGLPTLQNIHHDGTGYFAGVRVYLFTVSNVSFGLGAQAFSLKDDQYMDSTSPSTPTAGDSKSTGQVYSLVFSFDKFK